MSQSPSQRLASVEDLLLYRLNRLSSVAGAMVVRLCEGGDCITRREWGVVALLYENGSLSPSALAERMHRDRVHTSRTLTALTQKQGVLRTIPANVRRCALVATTPAERAFYEALMPQIQANNSQILSALQTDFVAQLNAALDSLEPRAESLMAELSPDLPKANRRQGQRRKVMV
jgi:DNA-binding MarR family transcriptional regulator